MKKKVFVIILLFAALCALCACDDRLVGRDGEQYVRLSESVKFMVTGESADLHAVFTPRSTAFEVEWESDCAGVARVDEGRVSALAAGRAQISVKIVGTAYKAVCEVIVSDIEVSEKYAGSEDAARVDSLEKALENAKDGDSILLFRGYHSCSRAVNKSVTILGEQGAFLGGMKVTGGARVNLENISFYASSPEYTAGLAVEAGCGARIKNCRFNYDVKEQDPERGAGESGEKGGESGGGKSGKEEGGSGGKTEGGAGGGQEQRGAEGTVAIELAPEFSDLSLVGCSFKGFEKALTIAPSDAEVYVRDNEFTDCGVAIEVDVRRQGNENSLLSGTIADNMFSSVEHPTIFKYNGGIYMGKLYFTAE